MLENRPSRTALSTAYLRAAHQLLDPPPRVLEDPLAVTVLGAGASDRIRTDESRYRSPQARALRAHVALRSRFAEDRLAEAVKRGVSQYVLLGAGLDTFAFRQPPWATSLRIVEIDHVNTQRFKLTMLSQARIEPPANVTFGAIDFDHESLNGGLSRHGVSPNQPTFFSWLGVTMYLTETSIDRALQSMGAFPVGSEVVLTFLEPRDEKAASAVCTSAQLASQVAAAGEPFVSYLRPSELDTKLQHAGYSTVHFLTLAEATALYFSSPYAALPLPSRTGVAYAIR